MLGIKLVANDNRLVVKGMVDDSRFNQWPSTTMPGGVCLKECDKI
jgi:hypothetical protein